MNSLLTRSAASAPNFIASVTVLTPNLTITLSVSPMQREDVSDTAQIRLQRTAMIYHIQHQHQIHNH